ncbi:hypothetical protein BKA69DRAFT_75363 [Paraphysoderma sedebokerense]|nr:hypothetical protein BKA69DRAFT_75363 [Paraphysoderma sedebokerense]
MLSKVSVIVLLTVLSIAATGRAEGEKPNGKKLYNIKLKETVANQDGFTCTFYILLLVFKVRSFSCICVFSSFHLFIFVFV